MLCYYRYRSTNVVLLFILLLHKHSFITLCLILFSRLTTLFCNILLSSNNLILQISFLIFAFFSSKMILYFSYLSLCSAYILFYCSSVPRRHTLLQNYISIAPCFKLILEVVFDFICSFGAYHIFVKTHLLSAYHI